jgi:hypothetical protein
MNASSRIVTLPALVAFALATGPALAQEPSSTPSPSSMPPSTHDHAQRHADAVERRIENLHAQLKITEQQSSQWDVFAQTLRDNARKADRTFRQRSRNVPTMKAPDAMKSCADITQSHAENMKTLAPAFSNLYDVMSPGQKRIADRMYRRPDGHMGASDKAGKADASAARPAA